MIKTAILAAIAAITTLAVTAPASAESVSVRYHDLDLTTPEGKVKLEQRLDAAARDACGYSAARTGTRVPSRSASTCYKQAQLRSQENMATIIEGARKGG